MKNNKYKVFFTISFFYTFNKKKTITKSFKSDVDVDSLTFGEQLNDSNIYIKWQSYALKVKLNNLNSPEKFIEANASKKKLLTHRIVNLINLTEVF